MITTVLSWLATFGWLFCFATTERTRQSMHHVMGCEARVVAPLDNKSKEIKWQLEAEHAPALAVSPGP